MNKKLLALGFIATLLVVFAVYGQAPSSQNASSTAAAPAPRAVLDQYCVGCHSQKAKSAGMDSALRLTLDNIDPAHVTEHADTWERVVRKLRAGMMPPANARRPEKATLQGLITWLENELDKNAVTYLPPPGLH